MKIILVCVIVFFYSCSNKGIKKDLMSADAITIHFYSNSQADSVIKIVHTTSATAIEKLASFIDNDDAKGTVCGHDGDIVFSKGEKTILKANFNALNIKCRQFEFNYNNTFYIKQMNNEAADFLTSLWAGKTYY